MKKLILFVLLIASFGASAQNQDVNPYGGIYYNDHSNYRMEGANGLPRTDHTNLDTLTNVLKGDLRFDTLNAVVVVYNGTTWVDLTSTGGAASTISLDDASLVVVPVTNVQAFADGVDAALLKARGTGVSTTYVSTVSVGGTTFAQPDVSGEIYSDQGYFSISHTGATGITVADLTQTSTYVYIDNAGALQQQTTEPTRQDWSRKMFTMRIGVNTTTNTIIGFEYLNNPIGHYANSMRDIYSYLLAQGIPFKKDQSVTGRATDLGFNVGAGSLLEFGGTGDIDNANIKNFNAVSNASYTLLSRTGIVSVQTDLVKFWDNAGTITALGSTTLVGHRLFRYSDGAFAMQYGQGNYANMALAKAGVLSEEYVLNPLLEDATLFGWWFIQSTATNTGGTTLTDFVEYTIGMQGASSTDHNTLDQSYDQGGAGVGRTIVADNGAVKIEGADGLLVTGTFGSGAVPEISGAGTRMFFNPAKSAFRVGTVTGSEWDDASIGQLSTALGEGSIASATNSTAIGLNTTASGLRSTAIGSSTTASGSTSTAMGRTTVASGSTSTAMGRETTAESFSETAIGLYNTDYTPTSTVSWSATDRLLVIGNGQSGALSDALIITKNGNLTMPTTTGALTPPKLTTTARDALTPDAGMMIYNTTTNKGQQYNGTIWNDLF
jgi:hypothetical protein